MISLHLSVRSSDASSALKTFLCNLSQADLTSCTAYSRIIFSHSRYASYRSPSSQHHRLDCITTTRLASLDDLHHSALLLQDLDLRIPFLFPLLPACSPSRLSDYCFAFAGVCSLRFCCISGTHHRPLWLSIYRRSTGHRMALLDESSEKPWRWISHSLAC
jgi:hypothetical protein